MHAVLCPQYLGLKIIVAKSFARIFWQNAINGGLLPVEFASPDDYDKLEQDDVLVLENARDAVSNSSELVLKVKGKDLEIPVTHGLSGRQVEIMLEGGIINWGRSKLPGGSGNSSTQAA